MEGSAGFSRIHLGADCQPDRGKDVGLFAVGILQESDPGGAIRIIFDGDDFCDDALLLPLEVDQAGISLMSAATMAHGHAAGVVAPAGSLRTAVRVFSGLSLVISEKPGSDLNRLDGVSGSEVLKCHNA